MEGLDLTITHEIITAKAAMGIKMKKYYLVTDATADQVTRRTGLEAHQTHLGALVEQPSAFNLDRALDQLDRAMHPNKPRCNCGPWTIIHRPNCPMGMAIT